MRIIAAIFILLCAGTHAQNEISVTSNMRWKHIEPVTDTTLLNKILTCEHWLQVAKNAYEQRLSKLDAFKTDGVVALSNAYSIYDSLIINPNAHNKAFSRDFYQNAAEVSRMYRQFERVTYFFSERERCYMSNNTHHLADCTCGHCPKGRDLILMMRLTN